MYVCICAGVTEDQIRIAAEDGVCSMRELSRVTGVATGCGQCSMLAKAILDESLLQQGRSKTTPALAADSTLTGCEQAYA